jgi:antirestriction protein ArdC
MPRNAATGRHYSGINVLILWGAVIQHGFPGQSWLTFRQALSLGGNVRRGERGTTVVYADRFTPEDEKRRAREAGEEAAAIPFLKRFTVFNAAQCDGLPEDVAVVAPPPPPGLIEPQVEALIRATGIDFRIGGDRAFYVPALDYVQVPPPQAYFEPINWHRTALHELGHATGHPSRLNRDFSGSFGSKKYAFEELVAEINAAFCCASLGITPTVRHADYIGSRCCARTIAPSSAPPPRPARRPTGCSGFCRAPMSMRPTTNGRRRDVPENRKGGEAGFRLYAFPPAWRCPPRVRGRRFAS